MPTLALAFLRPRISFALREKIYLAVTAINDCRFCQWGHSHWAVAHGVTLEEINALLEAESPSIAAANPGEAAAILYARHYAEQLGQSDPSAPKALHAHFTPAQVREILAHIRFITLTNLSGNTVDAFLGLIRPPHRAAGWFPVALGALICPLLLLIVALARLERALGIVALRARLHRAIHGDRPR
jgi:AhpD family alkylhydroperoxidase